MMTATNVSNDRWLSIGLEKRYSSSLLFSSLLFSSLLFSSLLFSSLLKSNFTEKPFTPCHLSCNLCWFLKWFKFPIYILSLIWVTLNCWIEKFFLNIKYSGSINIKSRINVTRITNCMHLQIIVYLGLSCKSIYFSQLLFWSSRISFGATCNYVLSAFALFDVALAALLQSFCNLKCNFCKKKKIIVMNYWSDC